jgi:hypothetical protein
MSRALYHLSYGTAGRRRARRAHLGILSRRLCPRLQLAFLRAALSQRHPLPLVHVSPEIRGQRRPGWLRNGCGGRIRTDDLRVMSPTSCRCSTPRGELYRRLSPASGAGQGAVVPAGTAGVGEAGAVTRYRRSAARAYPLRRACSSSAAPVVTDWTSLRYPLF